MTERHEQGIEPQKEQELGMRLEEFERIFRERPELIEEMKKVFSVSLQCAFAADYEGRSLRQWRSVDPYRARMTEDARVLLRTFEETVKPPLSFKPEAKTWQSDRDLILQGVPGKRHLAEVLLEVQEAIPFKQAGTWASLVFSVDDETAKRYWSEGQVHGAFAAPHDIQFHGIYIGIPRKEKRVPLAEAVQSGKFADATIDPELIKQFLEMLEVPVAECKTSLAEIERLGRELGINPEKIEKLKTTVREFATYVKPEPTTNEQCFREIGRCFTVPHTFRHFAREWHGLEVGQDFYAHSVMGHTTFWHEVNLVDGKIVVDWTARQYREFNKEPYPFVYRVGDECVHFGPLRNLERKKERQAK